jgi:hypothetical protein
MVTKDVVCWSVLAVAVFGAASLSFGDGYGDGCGQVAGPCGQGCNPTRDIRVTFAVTSDQ